jgi:hypothetical protein
VKSLSMTIRFAPFLLATFLAIQVSPLWAAINNVKGIDVIVKKKPGGALIRATTDDNGDFTVRVDGAGTYEVTASGGKSFTSGTSVKLSISVQSAKPGAASARQAPVSKTAVLDASGGLGFPGDIQVSEASVLTGHLEIVGTPAPAKEQSPAKTPIKK